MLHVANIPINGLHDAVFFILYAMCGLVTYLAVERAIYFWVAYRNAVAIERALTPGTQSFEVVSDDLLNSKLPAAVALAEVRARMPYLHERGDLEDATDTAYIHAKHHLRRYIWLFDTVITAAPLLGLLGTILGIIDTFQALAASGISDPAAVSRGIGVALLATAVGIGTALYALLLHSVFQAQLARIQDLIRIILMRVGFAQQKSS